MQACIITASHGVDMHEIAEVQNIILNAKQKCAFFKKKITCFQMWLYT